MKKTILLLAILTFGLGSVIDSKAQTINTVTFDNTSNCPWDIEFFSSGTPVSGPFTLPGNTNGQATFCNGITFDAMNLTNNITGCVVTFGTSGGTQGTISAYCGAKCTVINTTEQIVVTPTATGCAGATGDDFDVVITP